MTGGEQDWVVWKPMQAPRQHSVQYSPRKALLLRAPFRTLAQICSPPFSSNAFLQAHVRLILLKHSRESVARKRWQPARYQHSRWWLSQPEKAIGVQQGRDAARL